MLSSHAVPDVQISGEHFSVLHIKCILTGDCVTNSRYKEDDSAKEDSVGTPMRHNDLLKGGRNMHWIVRRLNEACVQLSSVYVRLYNQYKSEAQGSMSFEVELERSISLSFTSSPARDVASWSHNGYADESLNSPLARWKLSSEKSSRDAKLETLSTAPRGRHPYD